MEEKKNYYAIIPANVRYDERLSANSKLLYGEITALTNEKGYCWASDTYFSELYKVSKTSIQNWLRDLERNGYITREKVYEEGTKKITQRYIKLTIIPIQENLHTYTRKVVYPIQKKLRENNININNIFNNKKEKIDKKEKYFENTEVNDLFIEFLDLRKKLKAVNSERAINMLLNKLNEHNDEIKKQMLENSIMNSWKSVYPIKTNNIKNNFIKKEESLPDWFDKEIEVQTPNEVNRKQIEEIINSFKVKS